MILYHADRCNSLSEGMKLQLEKDYKLNDPKEAIFRKFYPEGLSRHGQQYIQDVIYLFQTLTQAFEDPKTGILYPSCIAALELTYANNKIGPVCCEMQFELVRKAFFPDKPSRWQSLFAVENIDDFEQWSAEGLSENYPVYEIEVDSSLQKFDSEWLKGTICIGPVGAPKHMGFSPSLNMEMPMHYWQGDATSCPRWEYIIPLPAVVGRRVR